MMPPADSSPVLLKVGGSLLNWVRLPEQVDRLQRHLLPRETVIVPGGGPVADLVRRWHRIHSLNQEQAHWLAVDTLTLTRRLLVEILPRATEAHDRSDIERAWRSGQLPVLDPGDWLRNPELAAVDPLPQTWDVTSDSIAAWIAQRIEIGPPSRLVLAKSVDLPADCTVEQAATRGLVDAHFAHCLHGLSVEWINLRSEPLIVQQWRDGQSVPAVAAD
jgi:dihydroneopterin aldolase